MPSASTPGEDSPMGRTYALVVICHGAVIAILWWFGRIFSR
jgi:hypothetical protein